MYQTYLETAIEHLKKLIETQAEAIQEAAVVVGEALAEDKSIYTFGSGHSQLIAREIAQRAGGLAPIFHLPDPTWGMVERIEGYGEILLQQYPIKAGEVIFVISNSGRNPEPIEVAIGAKEKGLKVIAVTSLTHSKSVESRHSSGKRLFEVAEFILDTGTPLGDAALEFEGLPMKAGALSTILGAAIMNAVMVQVIQFLLDRGLTPPVLISANVDGSDEHNAEIMARYSHMQWAPKNFF
ncbi:MAG TPA: SIS domain-containing protein [Anaerolineae bacterium]|nr:SIS domain-containing protein [Anaerolineae bacterium]